MSLFSELKDLMPVRSEPEGVAWQWSQIRLHVSSIALPEMLRKLLHADFHMDSKRALCAKGVLDEHTRKVAVMLGQRSDAAHRFMREVYVVVSRSDAWAKWKACFTTGSLGPVLVQLVIVAAFAGEMQVGTHEPFRACCWTESLKTLVFIGDDSHRIDHMFLAYARSPWTAQVEAGEAQRGAVQPVDAMYVTRRPPPSSRSDALVAMRHCHSRSIVVNAALWPAGN